MITPTTNTDQVTSTDRTARGPQPDQTPVAPSASGFGAVPVGGIVMYSGTFAAIPSNWALCDGTGGTPNLADKFILGTATYAQIGTTGGTLQHKHGVGTLVASAPTFTGTPVAAASTNATPDLVAADTTAAGVSPVTTAAGSVSAPAISGETALNASGDALPPYYKLAFIIRVS